MAQKDALFMFQVACNTALGLPRFTNAGQRSSLVIPMPGSEPGLSSFQGVSSINPKHRGAHEYAGEAYLAVNDPPKAKQHLAALDRLCFFPCEEYTDLKKAVASYEETHKP
jgi:hypothetical protein